MKSFLYLIVSTTLFVIGQSAVAQGASSVGVQPPYHEQYEEQLDSMLVISMAEYQKFFRLDPTRPWIPAESIPASAIPSMRRFVNIIEQPMPYSTKRAFRKSLPVLLCKYNCF